MKQRPESSFPVVVTVLNRSDCKACNDLIGELAPMQSHPQVSLHVIDLAHEPPPSFAQGFIVPATYIGSQLWRYGKFTWEMLEERLLRGDPVIESS